MRKVSLNLLALCSALTLVGATSTVLASSQAKTTVHAASLANQGSAVIIDDDNNIQAGNNVSKVFHWNDPNVDFTGAKVIVIHRHNLPGLSNAKPATKFSPETYDQSAFDELSHSAFYKKLKDALSQGTVVVLDGNDDGKLDDSLIQKLFGVQGPVEQHSNYFRAIALYAPTGSTPIAISMNYNIPVKSSVIANDALNYFNSSDMKTEIVNSLRKPVTPKFHALKRIIHVNSSATSSNGGGQVSGSGNLWYYNNLYYLYDNMYNQVGQFKMLYSLQRTYHDSSTSWWEIKMDTTTEPNTSANNFMQSSWLGVDNSSYTQWQEINNEQPVTTNIDQSSSTTVQAAVNFGYIPSNSGGTVGWSETWNYDVPNVSVTMNYNGYASCNWTHSYVLESAPSKSTYSYEPAVVMKNTAGYLIVPVDNKWNMAEAYGAAGSPGAIFAYPSTGDEYDTLSINDF